MTKIIVSFLLITDFIFAQENINHSTVSEDESITRLDLSKKGLTTLKTYDFSKYIQLEDIDLSDNNITHIKEDTFSKNEKLRSINLSGNPYLEFPKFSTIFISSIQELNISNCGIQTLPQSAFDGLRYLKIIDLSHNPMVKTSFPTTPFNTIESLEKVILPVENKQLLKELCLSFNLTIEIKNENENIPAVQCLNYIHYDESEEEESTTSPTAANLSVHLPDPEKPPVEISHEEPEKKQEKTKNEDATHTPISLAIKPKLEPREKVEISPVLPINGSALEQTNKTDTNPILNSTIKLATEITTTAPKLEPRFNINNKTQVEPEKTNITVPPIVIISNVTIVKPVEVNHTNKPVATNEPQPKPVTTTEVNKSEKIQLQNSTEPVKVGEITEASNTGSTILIVLVVLVVVAGLAAFGYKFYKNKTARAESEQVERELKEIVTNKTNRTETPQDVVEKEPLMNNHLNKENGDVKSSPPTNDSINNALNPHMGSVNKRNSGSPYQPTTTTFKPESTNEVK